MKIIAESIRFSRAAAMLLVAALCLVTGCGEKGEEKNSVPVPRMQDPKYVEALKASRAEQSAIQSKIAKLEAALKKEREQYPGSEKGKYLEKQIAAAKAEIEAAQTKARRLVGERIARETAAAGDAARAAKGKGAGAADAVKGAADNGKAGR